MIKPKSAEENARSLGLPGGSELEQLRKLLLGSTLGSYEGRIRELETQLVSITTTMTSQIEQLRAEQQASLELQAEREDPSRDVVISQLRERVDSLEATNARLQEELRALEGRLYSAGVRLESSLEELRTRHRQTEETVRAELGNGLGELASARRITDHLPKMLVQMADEIRELTFSRPVLHAPTLLALPTKPSQSEEEPAIMLSTADIRTFETGDTPRPEASSTALTIEEAVAATPRSQIVRPFTTADLLVLAPEEDGPVTTDR